MGITGPKPVTQSADGGHARTRSVRAPSAKAAGIAELNHVLVTIAADGGLIGGAALMRESAQRETPATAAIRAR